MTKTKSGFQKFEELLGRLFRVSKQELDEAVQEERELSRELREAMRVEKDDNFETD